MWGRLGLLAFAGCYAPRIEPGTPCTPEAGCPGGLQCAQVDGNYVCVEDPPPPPDVDAPLPPPDMPPPARWRLVQTVSSETSTVNIAETGPGHTLLVAIETGTAPVALVRDNHNTTYAPIPSSRAVNDVKGVAVELWIATSSKPNASRINISAPSVFAAAMWEIEGLAPTSPVVAVTTADNQAPGTVVDGAPLVTTADGQFALSIAILENTTPGLVMPSAFTNDHLVKGNGWAHLTDNAAPAGTYQAQWDQPTIGASCATSVVLRLP